MDDFGMPLGKRREIPFDKLAAENPNARISGAFLKHRISSSRTFDHYGCRVGRDSSKEQQ
jgi:hypothetical protein